MYIRILITIFFSFLPVIAYAESGEEKFLACDMPVLEYTTGESDEIPENLYSASVEWVIVEVFPIKNGVLSRGYDGWVALIELASDGDEALEDFVENPQNLAQVKFNGRWILQYDFERLLCDQKPDIKYFMGGPTRTALSLSMLLYAYAKVRCFRKKSRTNSITVF